MSYHIKPPKYYRKKFTESKALFQEVWAEFIHNSPNVESDDEVMDYLDHLASDRVNDESSPFYLYG
jgi:hypothetical protein